MSMRDQLVYQMAMQQQQQQQQMYLARQHQQHRHSQGHMQPAVGSDLTMASSGAG